MYRPFCQRYLYFSPQLNEMPNLMPDFFGEDGLWTNQALIFTDPTSQKPFMALATSKCPDMHLVGAAAGSVTMPLQKRGDSEDPVDNVTEWALEQFRKHYQPGRAKAKRPITKQAISHYAYSVLHNPVYREKYALNLKREFPRIPLYPDFWQWADWGKELMELHIGYEEVTPYKLKRVETAAKEGETPAPKALLKADKEHGCILVDGATTLTGVPAEAWEYRLGNRSALEWILDQYQERKPKDPTIREKFNTYRLADHKEKVIDLLMRVTTVSVRTQEVVRQMAAL
jgi:predicted helicase